VDVGTRDAADRGRPVRSVVKPMSTASGRCRAGRAQATQAATGGTFRRCWLRFLQAWHTARLVCPLDAAALKRFPSVPTPQSGSRGDPEIFGRAGNHVERWNSSFRLFECADAVCHFTHPTVRRAVASGVGGLRLVVPDLGRYSHLRRSSSRGGEIRPCHLISVCVMTIA
jgi:hypothetical protein